jgi:hypothetical protein
MLKAAEVIHRYFYDDPATFKDHWEDAVREKVKDIVLLH